MTHVSTIRRQAPVLGFALGVAAIAAGVSFALHASAGLADARLVAWAATVDLTVGVPLLYWFLLVRRREWPALSVLPVFLLALFAAGRVVPAEHQGLVRLVEAAVLPLELGVLGFVAWKTTTTVRRIRREARGADADFHEAARHTLFEVTGNRRVADVFAHEIAVFYYGLAAWRERPPEGAGLFSYHRKSGYTTVAIAVLIALTIELFAVHLLLHFLWSPVAAWVVSALSLYGMVWFLADLQAIRLRPIRVEDDRVVVRIGLRWNLVVARDDVTSVERLGGATAPSGGDYLAAVPIGAPSCVIHFSRTVTATGLYGIRRTVRRIGIAPDDADRFVANLDVPDGD